VSRLRLDGCPNRSLHICSDSDICIAHRQLSQKNSSAFNCTGVMQSLQTWLGGGAPDKEPAAKGASVLSEWNKYSGSSGAATTASPAVTTAELAAAEEGAAAGAASGEL
jgi:hypothetical protein